jgi:DNA-directed RNA polymerase subunit beta'
LNSIISPRFSEVPEWAVPTMQVSDQLYNLKSRKRINKIVNFLIKDLTSIFIKIVLKNKNFKLNFWSKFRSNFDSKESSHFCEVSKITKHLKNISFFITFEESIKKYLSSGSCVFTKHLKINQFKEIKKNLINNFLVSNLGFIYKKLITNRSTISNYSLIKTDLIVGNSVDISSIVNVNYDADINFFKHYLTLNKLKQFKNKLKVNLTGSYPLKGGTIGKFTSWGEAPAWSVPTMQAKPSSNFYTNPSINLTMKEKEIFFSIHKIKNQKIINSEGSACMVGADHAGAYIPAPTFSELNGGVRDMEKQAPFMNFSQKIFAREDLSVKYFKSTIKTKKLFNNIYCLSHRERWEGENDWNFLYYYVTVQNSNTTPLVEQNNVYQPDNNRLYLTPLNTLSSPVEGLAPPVFLQKHSPRLTLDAQLEVFCKNTEKIIHNYKNRFENIYKTDFFNHLNNSKMDADFPNSFSRSQSIHSSFDNISINNLSLNSNTLFSGPGIVQLLLSEFNFFEIKKIDKQNRILLYQLNKQILKLKKKNYNRTSKKELKEAYKKRDLLIRRTKLVRKLFIKESSPQNMILTVLPVLPPDLRPIVKMGGQIAASDLNRLYQRVIYRNDRLKKFLKDPATSNSYEMKYAQRLLQEAVDNLIQNGKSGVIIEKDSRGRALKSLSDILKGKQGRFRQYLLGKRVDYSGRSVIVVGPRLKLHECGIPKEMALELYLPFLLKRILNDKLSRTVVGAKLLIKTNPSLVWELLREIMQTSPVLLNRAPTLHRLGIQAFQPKLIDGRAILLHPLVCAAFNADFDGDQMAVHVPITVEARAEAWKLMLSRNSILSTATGDPLAIPSQDMVLGCYYLTTNLLNATNKKLGSSLNQIPSGRNFLNELPAGIESNLLNKIEVSKFDKKIAYGFYFSTIDKVLKALELKKVTLHSNIWLKCSLANVIDNGSDQEEPIEIRLEPFGNWREIYNKSQKRYNFKNICLTQFVFTTPGKIIFNLAIQKALN